jgi:hypothetical protein
MVTPFSRVAEAVVEAEAGRKPLGRMGPAAVNRWGIGLSVYPAQGSVAAERLPACFRLHDGFGDARERSDHPDRKRPTFGTTQLVRRDRAFRSDATAFDGAIPSLLSEAIAGPSCDHELLALGDR